MSEHHPDSLGRHSRLSGFTLIEVLVALVISLLGALAIMQVYVNSEAGKRATGSLAESQSSGLAAIFSIERDLQQVGLGLMHLAALGCNVRSNLASNFNNLQLQPVTIVPAAASAAHTSNLWGIPPGDANSDMIAIATGSASSMAEGAMLTIAAGASTTTYRLSNVSGITAGDYLLLAESGKDCTLTTVAANPAANGDVTVTYAGVPAYSLNAPVLHLGRLPQLAVYAVRNGTLTRCDFVISNCANTGLVNDTTVWVPVANDVVALIAQYGFDATTPPDMTADVYCKSALSAGACPGSDDGLTAPGTSGTQSVRACDWTRVPLIQLALITRSGQYEKDEVSPATIKLWTDNTSAAIPPTTIGPVWNVPDRHYRYRVTRSAVALRNVIWMGAQSSC